MSYLNETRYHWFSLDSEADLTAATLELSLDGTTWVAATHTTEPALADLPAPEAGFTRYWWKALFGPAEALTLTQAEQTVYGRIDTGAEELRPQWVIRSELAADVFPCDWPVDYCSSDGELPSPLSNMDATKVQRFERMAIDFLWNWTGQRYGTCQVAYRPCRELCPPGSRSQVFPALVGGQWYNIACGACGDSCGCTYTPTLRLPDVVLSVDEVLIDGAVLDPSNYRLDANRFLRRLDGNLWPICQDLREDTTQPGTWEITWTAGRTVPTGGQIAAGVLAVELAKAACNDTTCALPKRIQSITRQGIAIVMDDFKDLDHGGTGIWLIDSWISSVMKAPAPSRVYSPDVRRSSPVRPVR